MIDSVDELPDGILNLVHGARDAVNGLLDHPGIDAISFVGQASTARYIAERSAAVGKRFQALGGAKNSLIVMPDADLTTAVPAIMSSAFGAGGQRCLAGSVAVLVGTRQEQDQALDALSAASGELGVGPGDEDGVVVCPLVGPEARERIDKSIAVAQAGTDEVILDGRRDPGKGGSLIGPSIIVTSDVESDLAREELFGPLLSVVRVDDLDAALEFANGSRYGNAGSIFTSSGGRGARLPMGRRSGNAGSQHRRGCACRMVSVLGLEGLDRWRSARQWIRCGRLLHA